MCPEGRTPAPMDLVGSAPGKGDYTQALGSNAICPWVLELLRTSLIPSLLFLLKWKRLPGAFPAMHFEST